MEYTTFIENGHKPDSYDRLEFFIEGAGKTVPVYVIATSLEDYSLEQIKERTQDINGIETICQVNGTIDMVVKGKNRAKKIADKLYKKEMIPIGIAKYDNQGMGKLWCELGEALDLARKEGKPHLYEPKKDSVEARAKAALASFKAKNK